MAQTMPSSGIQHRIDEVCACLTTKVVEKDDPHACQSLQDRMAADRVPGVSIAVIHNGAIENPQLVKTSSDDNSTGFQNDVGIIQTCQMVAVHPYVDLLVPL